MGAPKLQTTDFFAPVVGDAFIQAMKSTLETYCQLTATKISHKVAPNLKITYPVGAVVNFTSNETNASFLLAFSPDAIFDVYEKMTGVAGTKEVNADIKDCVGELTNIIYGVAKAKLSENGYKLGMALPVTMTDFSSEFNGRVSLELVFEVPGSKKLSLVLSV